MKFKLFLSISFLILICFAFAQSKTLVNPNPRYRIFLKFTEGKSIKGLLIQLEDSTVMMFQGNRKQWKNNTNATTINYNYSQIQKIKLKRKNGLLRGALIGTVAGFSPLLVGSLFGPDAAYTGAFISVFTVPLGFISGSINGGILPKTYYIGGDFYEFLDLKKRIKRF
jgi:hypothetical protein